LQIGIQDCILQRNSRLRSQQLQYCKPCFSARSRASWAKR
jgi:hypothetical protein